MRPAHLLLGLAWACAPGLAAQPDPLRADPDSAAVREVVALEHHLAGLLNRGDWEAYAPYVAEDYRQTNRRGEVRSKADVLAALRAQGPAPPDVEVTPDSVDVRVYGDVAVLQAVLTGRRTEGGAVTFRSRILKVFVRRRGHWYLVAMQGTPLP